MGNYKIIDTDKVIERYKQVLKEYGNASLQDMVDELEIINPVVNEPVTRQGLYSALRETEEGEKLIQLNKIPSPVIVLQSDGTPSIPKELIARSYPKVMEQRVRYIDENKITPRHVQSQTVFGRLPLELAAHASKVIVHDVQSGFREFKISELH